MPAPARHALPDVADTDTVHLVDDTENRVESRLYRVVDCFMMALG